MANICSVDLTFDNLTREITRFFTHKASECTSLKGTTIKEGSYPLFDIALQDNKITWWEKWSPADEIMEDIAKLFPENSFSATFSEPGCVVFGSYVYDGETLYKFGVTKEYEAIYYHAQENDEEGPDPMDYQGSGEVIFCTQE